MRIGTWSVRSMVDTEGPLEVANQGADGQRGEDREDRNVGEGNVAERGR